MSTIETIRKKFYEKPLRNDITMQEVEKFVKSFGCQIKQGANHTKIYHIETGTVIPIPRHGKTIGEVYVKQIKDLYDNICNKREDDK